MKRQTLYILLTLLLCIPLISHALDVRDFTYSHLGKAEGVDNQRIFSICQTKSGVIWWSSKTGVDRYNGSVVTNYQLGDGTHYGHNGGRVINLATNSSSIYAFDNRGSIYLFDDVRSDFILIASLSKIIGHEVALNDIFVSDKGLYLAMHDGVFLLKDGKLKTIMKGPYVNKIVKAIGGMVFCTREGIYNEQGKRLLPYNVESAYYDDKTGKLWIGCYDKGLNTVTIDIGWHVIKEEIISMDASSRQYPIRCICPYDNTTMLIGIDGLGVYQVNRNGSGNATLLFDANDSFHGVLHGNGVYCLMVDNWRNIVIGSYSGGIDIARPIGSTTAVYQHIANNTQSLLNDHVSMVAPLSDHSLMMGTDNGISIVDTKTNSWKHCCQGIVAVSVCKVPNDKYLVTTYGKGVYEINSQGVARQVYTTSDGMLKDDHVYAAYSDRDGNLWIGSLNGDLLRKSPSGEKHYYPIHDVQVITQLPSGIIAVGTGFGLKLINLATDKVSELNYAPKGVKDFTPFVTHMLLYGQELWIATDGGGIYVYDLKKKESRQLTISNGLPTNYVSSLAKGTDGRIWIGTEKGLAFVSPQNPDKVINVNYCYGLDREYSRGAVANLPNGDILFGTTTGAVVVKPKNIQSINYKAELSFLGVSFSDNKDYAFNKIVHKMLDKNKLMLEYGQRTFNLHFESVNMRNHFDIVYRYKIDNGEWSEPSDQQYIRFVSLEPGKHRLTLQCVSRTNGTVIDTKTLTIIISQPWWNSWWMWIIYIAAVIAAFYGAWRVYQLHEKYMRLTIDHLKLNDSDNTTHSMSGKADTSVVSPDKSEQNEDNDAGKEFVDKATKLILKNIGDSDFNIDRLCGEMALSRTLFYVKLKSYTGKSPQDFIRIIRLERAATMLRNGHSVTDAATLTGFDNAKYFSTVFKKYFGVSPSKYQ